MRASAQDASAWLARREDTDPRYRVIAKDQRNLPQRDRDRILYTSSLRRLGEITQVASPAQGHVFHTRLTHTFEVEQIAQRLAEKLISETSASLVEAVGGINPEVVRAAALAHDLGHPPFGHIAEKELDDLLTAEKVPDGFEGNAQSFRIITRLAIRSEDFPGLNLTRATLNATLKYPWTRGTAGKSLKKWGAYASEQAAFDFARQYFPFGQRVRSVEAEIMDWADDVAYSVHDIEDFYRAGLIPLDRLVKDDSERERFITSTLDTVLGTDRPNEDEADKLRKSFIEVIGLFPIDEPYIGDRHQRALLRTFTSQLIGKYIAALSLTVSHTDVSLVDRAEGAEREVTMLKELTRYYVFNNPSLATQQYGQKKVIRDLFCIFLEASKDPKDWNIFPARYKYDLGQAGNNKVGDVVSDRERVVADLVAGMGENQALEMHRRLTGTSPGSILDLMAR